MRHLLPAGGIRFLAGLIWIWLCAGCGRESSHERFVPTPEKGVAALDAALEDWKAGNPPGAVAANGGRVQVIDTHRKKDQTLTSFEVLGEVPGEAPRCFAVRIKLANPDAEEKIRYVVVGIDPLWVIRHDDYELIGHWDHAMPDKNEKKVDQ